MDDEESRPNAEFLFDSLVSQAIGHSKYSDNVEMPNKKEEHTENNQTFEGKIKQHPIANSVYFSGISEVNNLPHQSVDAIKQYLEFMTNAFKYF